VSVTWFKGSKVERLDNSRNKSDVMSKDRGDQPASRNQQPACDEPFGRELRVERLRAKRLPSTCSGSEPVEGSRVEAGTLETLNPEP
jgi:hypothetical protein